ncbi:hypothetical protein FJZ17_04375 [Candidatus Pacearchaeota archaeon]|nr:hypothetical protein [Candidatus Pacearchaeota archaeon]
MGYELKLGSSSGSYSSRPGSSCSTGYSSHSCNRAPQVFSRSDYLPRGSGTGDYNGNPENKLGMRLDL